MDHTTSKRRARIFRRLIIVTCIFTLSTTTQGCIDTVLSISEKQRGKCFRLCDKNLLYTGLDVFNGEITCTCKDHRRHRIERIDDYYHDTPYD